MTLLEVSDLARSFGGVQAVRGIGFALQAGEILALIGPNGAGKSTCFNMLNGQVRPDRGSVRFNGLEIVGLAPRKIARLGVGRTFQIAAAFSSMTVRENVQAALLASASEVFRFAGFAGRRHQEAADSLLGLVGLLHESHRPAAELAYGDLKRLEFAMALANAPKLLLMDEPTAGMAPKERAALMTLVSEIVRDRAIGVLFTEHDMDVVFGHADRIMVLDRGQLIAEGSADEVRGNPQVRAIYLGERH